MNPCSPARCWLVLLMLMAAGFGQAESPYRVEISAVRSTLFFGQPAEVVLTIENLGDGLGPEVSRTDLVGPESFVCAVPPRGEGTGVWKGEWGVPEGRPPEGSIALGPGETLSIRATVGFPAALVEGSPVVYVEWKGRGPLAGLRSNQVVLSLQEGRVPIVTVETTAGPVVLELWPDKCPNHVASFIGLIERGFYDGLLFHRIKRGFMIQGGCPQGTGLGDPGYLLPPEFNDTPFKKGVLGMARGDDPASAGSQFFICVADAMHLNGKYTAFGRVLEGQDVADQISNVQTNDKDRPLDDVLIKRVRVALPKGYELPEVQKASK